RGHGGLELMQPVSVGVAEPILILPRYADDHERPPSAGAPCASPPAAPEAGSPPPSAAAVSLGAPICACSPPPVPISPFIFASSSSTSDWLESCLSWRSMSSSP